MRTNLLSNCQRWLWLPFLKFIRFQQILLTIPKPINWFQLSRLYRIQMPVFWKRPWTVLWLMPAKVKWFSWRPVTKISLTSFCPAFPRFRWRRFFWVSHIFFLHFLSIFHQLCVEFQIIIGVVGGATKIRLIHQMLYGTIVVGLSECLSIADRCDLNLTDVAELLQRSGFESTIFNNITKRMCILMIDIYKFVDWISVDVSEISNDDFASPTVRLDCLCREMQHGLDMTTGTLTQPSPMVSTALNVNFIETQNFY